MRKRADDGMGFILKYENVAWYEDGKVRILDRRIYPIKTEFVVCETYQEVAQAIADMVTQSAGPYTAAAMGMALAAYEVRDKNYEQVISTLTDAAYVLSHARPTTTQKMQVITKDALIIARQSLDDGINGLALVDVLQKNAFNYINNNYIKYESIGKYLASLFPKNATILTQCFAETVLGTTLNECKRLNNDIRIICAETRPYFQGARLTASLCCDMGFDTYVISDNMPACIMEREQVDLFTSASDVITMDGHIVNKIGTFQIAIAASYLGIPYYVTGTPNIAHENISSVKIEYRDSQLVKESMGVQLTMDEVKAIYPAFDIVPPKLCNGVVTDKGIYSPYDLRSYYENIG